MSIPTVPRSLRAVALAATLAVTILLVSGCGSDVSDGGDASSGQGNVAVYAVGDSFITDWDPAVEASNGIMTLNNVYETLLRWDPMAEETVPVLATSYETSKDGMQWTFHLREGVKFHDGTVMDADAVKSSIERTIRIAKGSSYIWEPVDSIEAADASTVVFKLKYPAPLDLIVSAATAAFIVSPTAVESNPESWFTDGNEAGTGPYMLERWAMNDEVILTAFPDYWGGWKDNQFSKVLIETVSEPSALRQLVEQGECDVTNFLSPNDLEALQSNPDVEVVADPSYNNLLFCLNTASEPLNNRYVRQALSYAFPYADCAEYGAGGFADVAVGPVPATLWGHLDEAAYTQDMDEAKRLMAKGGYPNGGFKLLLTYVSASEMEKKCAELFKSQLAELGVDLELRGMPFDTMMELARTPDPEKRQDVVVFMWWPDMADPFSYLYGMFHTEKEPQWNLSYWSDPKFDELLFAANATSATDREAAAGMYVEAQGMLSEQAPAISALDLTTTFVVNKRLKGFTSNPAYANVVFFYETHR